MFNFVVIFTITNYKNNRFYIIFIFKIQNSIALLIMFFGVLVFRIDKSITGLLVLISLILLGSFIFFDEYIPFLNLYRNALL